MTEVSVVHVSAKVRLSPNPEHGLDPLESGSRGEPAPQAPMDDRLDRLMTEMGSLKESVARMSACLDRLTDSHAHLAERIDEASALGREDSVSVGSSPTIGRMRLSGELFVEECSTPQPMFVEDSSSSVGRTSFSEPRDEAAAAAAVAPAETASLATEDDEVNEDDVLLMQRGDEDQHDDLQIMLKDLKAAQKQQEQQEVKRSPTSRLLMQKRHGSRFILTPETRMMNLWNGLLALLIAVTVVSTPLQLAFEEAFENTGYTVFAAITDTAFVVDIFVNFRTAYDKEGRLIREPRKIARRYMMSWFFIDLIAGFPVGPILQLISAINGSDNDSGLTRLNHIARLLRFSKVLRVLRVFRVAKLAQIISQLEASGVLKIVSPPVLRLFRLCFAAFLVWHWVGCIWLFICKLEAEEDAIDAENEWVPPAFLAEAGHFQTWWYAIYWGMAATLAQDRVPHTLTETIYTVICGAAGIFFLSLIIGGTTESLAEMNEKDRHHREQLETLGHYMRYRRVPMKLQRRVRAYFRYVAASLNGLDELDLLGSLPDTLRLQLSISLNRKLFLNVKLFRQCDAAITLALAQRLKPKVALPAEFLLEQGHKVRSLFLLCRGLALELKRDPKKEEPGAHHPTTPNPAHPMCLYPLVPSPAASLHPHLTPVPTRPVDRLTPTRPVEPPPPRAPAIERAFTDGDLLCAENPNLAPRQPRAGLAFLDDAMTFLPASDELMVDAHGPDIDAMKLSISAGYTVLRELHDFDSFGETAFLAGALAKASVRAVSYCDLMVLKAQAFEEVRKRYPALSALIKPLRAKETHSQRSSTGSRGPVTWGVSAACERASNAVKSASRVAESALCSASSGFVEGSALVGQAFDGVRLSQEVVGQAFDGVRLSQEEARGKIQAMMRGKIDRKRVAELKSPSPRQISRGRSSPNVAQRGSAPTPSSERQPAEK